MAQRLKMIDYGNYKISKITTSATRPNTETLWLILQARNNNFGENFAANDIGNEVA